jgi:predicted DNA-binding protein (MmcQ/YjbR family)
LTPDALDAFCRSLPAATMDLLWGADQVYKVGGKMFAVVGPGGTLAFKANDIAFEMLVETGAARPAPYMARARWVFVDDPASFDPGDLQAFLQEAHALTALKLTRKHRVALGLA